MILTQVGEAVDVASSVINSKDSGFMLALLVLFAMAFVMYKGGSFMFGEYRSDKAGAWKDINSILLGINKIIELLEEGIEILKGILSKLNDNDK